MDITGHFSRDGDMEKELGGGGGWLDPFSVL